MSKYLSGEGLSHFMSKIKSWAADTFAPLSHTHDYTKTRVKGNAETSYRTGDVNLTYANIGTVPIANGGTGAATAESARTNLGLSSIGYYDGYIRTQPENSPVIIPFINNDIAFLLKRGGSAVVKYDDVVQDVNISNVFDGSPSYWAISYTGTTEIVIELTLHRVFTWTNCLYIDFGPWWTKTIKVEVMRSDATYTNDVWTEKFSTTTNTRGFIVANVTHTPVGASNSGGGFNKVRLTFSFANGAYSSSMFRIAQIGVINFGSAGLRETYMSRGIDDYLFRSITPNNDKTYDLGLSSRRWNNLYSYNSYLGTVTAGYSANTSTYPDGGYKVHDVRNLTGYSPSSLPGQTANFLFTLTDTPSSDWWGIFSIKPWGGNYGAWQLAGPASSSNSDEARKRPLYVRAGNNATWSSWRKLFDDAQTIPIANGGTGKTTAAEAWTALGGGAIGKKSTLAASDIPSLAISKITNLQTSLDGKAPLASPDFTGTPTAPTAATGTNTTQVATTAFVKDALDNLTVYSEDIEYGTGTVAEALDEMSQTVHNLPSKVFSKVKVGTTTMEADSAADTLTLTAGTNVTLTPDAANDSVTISVANATGYSLDNDIIGRATDYGPLYFSEDAGDAVVVDGPLPVEYGGTGVATIAALKTALGLGDSGWQTLPLGSAFKAYGTSYTPMYRKVNGVVEVTGGVSPNTAQTLGETALTIGTLPTGFRPASNRNVQVICQASGRKLWLMRIDSSGVVSAQRMRDMGSTSYQSMATNEWMLFSATFLAG